MFKRLTYQKLSYTLFELMIVLLILGALAAIFSPRSHAQSGDAIAPSSLQGTFTTPFALTGSTWDRLRTPNIFKNVAAASVNAEATVWTPASGKKFRLMGYCLSQGTAAGNVTLKDNTAGTTILIVPKHTLDAASCAVLGNGILSAAANNVLTATGVATETISGFFFGTEE